MNEKLSHDAIKEQLLRGYSFPPATPGLKEAARDLIRPLVEKMDGREIIYVCRSPKLMRVNYLEMDDDGFRAVATPSQDVGCRIPTFAEFVALHRAAEAGLPPPELPVETEPFDFGASWVGLRMSGSAICMNMLTDHFFPDPTVVAEVKAAVARGATREISAILDRASTK